MWPHVAITSLVAADSEEVRTMQHYARKRINRQVHKLLLDLATHLPAFDEALVARFCRVVEVNYFFPVTSLDYKHNHAYTPQVVVPDSTSSLIALVEPLQRLNSSGSSRSNIIVNNINTNISSSSSSNTIADTSRANDNDKDASAIIDARRCKSDMTDLRSVIKTYNEKRSARDDRHVIPPAATAAAAAASSGGISSTTTTTTAAAASLTVVSISTDASAGLPEGVMVTNAVRDDDGGGVGVELVDVRQHQDEDDKEDGDGDDSDDDAIDDGDDRLSQSASVSLGVHDVDSTLSVLLSDAADLSISGRHTNSVSLPPLATITPSSPQDSPYNNLVTVITPDMKSNRSDSIISLTPLSLSLSLPPLDDPLEPQTHEPINSTNTSSNTDVIKIEYKLTASNLNLSSYNLSLAARQQQQAAAAASSSSLTGPTGPRVIINTDLLLHVRVTFLEVLRTIYWQLVTSDKMPRNSTAALELLNSVDFAHDKIHRQQQQQQEQQQQQQHESCQSQCQDWEYLKTAINTDSLNWLITACRLVDFVLTLIKTFLVFLLSLLPCSTSRCCLRHTSNGCSIPMIFKPKVTFFAKKMSHLINYLYEEKSILLLSSFIEGHERAARKIPQFLGEEDVTDTPEEEVVLRESAACVKEARTMLDAMDTDAVSYHVSKQVV